MPFTGLGLLGSSYPARLCWNTWTPTVTLPAKPFGSKHPPASCPHGLKALQTSGQAVQLEAAGRAA